MKLKLSGPAGAQAKVAMRASPPGGTTVIKGKGESAELFTPSVQPQVVGVVPCTVVFTVNFDFRPWEFVAELLIGESSATAETSSLSLGFPSAILIRPDTLRLTIELTTVGGGAAAGGGNA